MRPLRTKTKVLADEYIIERPLIFINGPRKEYYIVRYLNRKFLCEDLKIKPIFYHLNLISVTIGV